MNTRIISLEDFEDLPLKQFLAEVNAQFDDGAGRIELTKGSKMVGRLISPEEASRQMARQIAEHWLTNKEAMERLSRSLDEKPETW